MKRLNDKGFTLVELLAVLVILITILTIAIPSIISSIDRNKESIFNKKKDIIEAAAEVFVNQNKNNIKYKEFKGIDTPSTEPTCCINIEKIKDYGFLSEEDLKDGDNKEIIGFVCYDKTNKKYIYYDSNQKSDEC